MGDKKHIDRLFQERFKDFEVAPSDAVWKHIEARLDKKKKKRRIIIPIWWRYAGVAALLLLLLTVGMIYFNQDNTIPENQVVNTEKTPSPNNENTSTPNGFNNQEGIVTNSDNSENISDEEGKGETPLQPSNNIPPLSESAIAETTSPNNKNSDEPSNKVLNTKSKTAIANYLKEDQSKDTDPLITIDKAKDLFNKQSQDITDIVSSEKTEDNKTNNNAKQNPLTIEDALEGTKDIIEKEGRLNRWRIIPNAAPVYFSSLGEGSSIDPQFNNNSKSGELNMSYGITASYAINRKLSIRSGINKVNLGYNTNNIVVIQTIGINANSKLLQNVAIAPSNNINSAPEADMSFISNESLSASKRPETLTETSNTSINQALGFIEVPLEIEYALLNKKLGVNIIGGFSSFFLSNNKIYTETEGSRSLLGEATNLNKVSYSANLGLGLNYKISKRIDLGLEPMFKYQINTFNNTSGNFKPYFIGVYTGFAIKF
ncbi:hypothetical protein [Snuella sedimenti]|uniref:Outer membrane protein beta-barrel domain-containing protein n=1 Tax=Snuella sedimenti TaxID=2798802 RepID=A0A8J7IFR4_9FLAO|nr:hypothetical protein [Snuella sedimenti]MBJ6368207.1 hypothetical protein [Snuella sedimenti]